ncbi:DUF4350 domain-containing protein [Kitasatospora acidiphila]|uniref:DUF4350 domain-containing protein n=1 Tax=Kitasatospora acidiphila TaxID=2567942 RepID=A0A540W866_9ACTN|nr:DUF4350 domain-containing protein [Kitasatospora acidiphila]TQF05188.1 DUF4350 domain-containing protein [Kitasatospora acidiphila]
MTTNTPLSPTARQLWLRTRWFLAGGAGLLLAGLLVAGLGDNTSYPSLDPRSPDADGTRAAVQLLRQRGVTVTTTGNPADLAAADAPSGGDTVVVPLPDLLTADQLDALGRAGHRRLVLVSPGPVALGHLAPGVQALGTTDDPLALGSAGTDADCTLAEAERAGHAEGGGRLYQAGPGTTACYPRSGHPTLVRTTGGSGGEVIVIGSGRFLTNQRLAQDGNAALALGLLGSQPRLTWYLPDYSAAAATAPQGQKSFTQLIPAGWHWAFLQLAIAAGLAALWRGRRLGPVVSENLPVVVRASETTEGRARLYQLGKARGRAADALRRAARRRLAPVLAVPLVHGEPSGDALLAALTARLGEGRTPGELTALLYGPPPTDDDALLRLADDLDALERQVRQP